MSSRGRFGPLVGAIDEGTSSARFLVFAANTAEVLTYHQEHIEQICPKEGWVEQDPMEILRKVEKCLETSVDHLNKLDIDPGDIVSIGLTNQRETTIVWDPLTGKPLYNAIVWLDVRNADIVENLKAEVQGKKAETLKVLSGLPISTYFSALKLRWLLDNVPEVRVAVDEERCLFGTVDTWLLWNLTGGVEGGLHITDVTNASRTMLMNLQTLQWDSTLCRFFGIPMSVLPKIRSSSEIYGYLAEGSLRGVPISGCLGDQQAALVGQMCLKQGQAKNTYGTGCFLLYNTGTAIVQSSHGLLTTVAYQLGRNAAAVYALEGSVAVAGAAVSWLRDNLQVLADVKLTAGLAQAASTTGQVVFVPAFSGLYAPYWRNDARGLICGFSEETKKEQLVKAALEAVCFQTRDILEAMHQDCGIPLTRLLVDGGMTVNSYAMQLQADLCGIPVVHPWMFEATALGAAMAAGSAEGIQVWDLRNMQPVPSDTYMPTISEDERDLRYAKWKMGIQRSTGWDLEASHNPNNNHKPDADAKVSSMLPCGVFVMSTFALLLVNNAWRNKSSEKFADLLSCRHSHAGNMNLHVNNPEGECGNFFDSPLDELVAAHLRCIKELRRKDYTAAYESQTAVVQSVTKMFQNLREDNWLLNTVHTVCLDLRLVATGLVAQPGVDTKPLEKAAECLMSFFRICTTDNRTSEGDTKRWGMMSLVNQLFKVYFRINKLHLMKPLIRAIDSSVLKDRFTLGQQITYRYFVGRMAMFYSDYATANEYLTYAFTHCHKQSKKNKRLILLNLVPVKILLGYMPTKAVLEKYDLLQLWEVMLAVKKGCISELSKAMQEHQTFFIKCGIYLIIEKLKIVTYRNLFKKVYLCVKTHQIPMNDLLVALRLMENESIELEEAHCILANLINEGKVKGYISIQHQKLVLSKIEPFPKLSTLNN